MNMSEKQLIELETKLTYQEDLIQELNTIVTKQQAQLDRLTDTCKSLDNRLKDVMQSLPDNQNINETPPHY